MKYNRPFLMHILDEINFIKNESQNLEYENLLKNEVLKRAFIRSLEVIGEATENVSRDFREEHPELEWKELAGLRDILIHRYFGVRWDIVWKVIKEKIPPLKESIERIIKELKE